MAESPDPPPQTPNIKAEHQSDGALKAQPQSNDQTKSGTDTAIRQEKPSAASETKSHDRPKEGAHEASEFWTIGGRSLKITDTLLVVFTFLLFLATVALFWATRDLVEDAKHSGEVNSSNMQAAIAESRRSADAATHAADAARDSVRLAERTAERQLRAYVVIDKATVTLKDRRLTGVLEIKNSGQTPAYDLTVVSEVTAQSPGMKRIEIPQPMRPPITLTSKTIIAPGGESRAPSQFDIAVSDDFTIPALKDGRRAVYLVGQIRYRDVFDHKWILDIQMTNVFIGVDSWRLAALPDGIQETEEK